MKSLDSFLSDLSHPTDSRFVATMEDRRPLASDLEGLQNLAS
ncbi:MAG: hypothetical protein AAGA21_01915 [Pseudomonadota bacterium]